MSTLVLTRKDVTALLDMGEVIGAVEQAFKDLASGKARMPPKSYLSLEKGDFRAMPASIPGAAGMKWVNVHPGNPPLGLPTVMAVLVYNNPSTGYPLSVMDATEITSYRTGATAALASKYLARKDSRTLGIIGAGRQAYTQLTAHAALFDFDEIRVYDISKAAVEKFMKVFQNYPVKSYPMEETVASDILCTVTPARSPVVKKEWVVPGTHINAIGADAEGKEELEPAVLDGAVVVVDDIRQASASGEINVPISKGLFRVDQIYATLGDIISGKKTVKRDRETVTVFDSTGVAIEDIAVARLIYEKAKKKGGYLSIEMVEG